MTIDVKIYDTHTLLGVMTDMPPPSNYWLDLCFPRALSFDDEYIDFEKIVKHRKLAPFVAPLAQGKPIYSEGSTVTRFKPAYVKPKDAVNPSRMLQRSPGELLAPAPRNPAQRYNAVIADIMREHREAIERRWEWLAAQAVLNGTVTISGENYPERAVSFNRDAGHTITLGAGARWGEAGVKPVANINTWIQLMRQAKFGGPANRITLGSAALAVFLADADVRALLNTQTRGTKAELNIGIREGANSEFIGKLSENLEVWSYSDYYENEDGTTTAFMDPRDIVLTGPNVSGVRCFGAILDANANFNAQAVFSKMWQQQDPSVTYVMSQSAPLMVPVNPNNTLRARVLA